MAQDKGLWPDEKEISSPLEIAKRFLDLLTPQNAQKILRVSGRNEALIPLFTQRVFVGPELFLLARREWEQPRICLVRKVLKTVGQITERGAINYVRQQDSNLKVDGVIITCKSQSQPDSLRLRPYEQVQTPAELLDAINAAKTTAFKFLRTAYGSIDAYFAESREATAMLRRDPFV